MGKTWSKEDVNFLIQNYKNFTYKEIGTYLKRSEKSVLSKMRHLQLNKIGKKNLNLLKELNELKKPELIYFLGYFYADGHITKNQYNIVLRICKNDYENLKGIFSKVAEFHIYEKDIYYTNNKRLGTLVRHNPSITLVISSKAIKEWFVINGFENKSFFTPIDLLNKLDPNSRNLFFRGYFDGDGCISITKKNQPQLILATDKNHDLKFLSYLPGNFRTYTPQASNGMSVISTGKENFLTNCSYIYKNYENDQIGLSRKYNKYKLYKDGRHR